MSKKVLTSTVAAAIARKPLAAYLRLTVDRQGNKIGYDAQEAAINRWAAYAGETIGKFYKDKDITAADREKDRPAYEQMLADVADGMWGGIVVWRLDRLVRLMFEIERCFRIVEDANAFIVSIDPTTIDSRDPLGKIFMRILVMFAEMEIDTMKARGRAHRQQRARDGLYNGGGARPYGFEGPVYKEKEEGDDSEPEIINRGRIGIAHVSHEVTNLKEAAVRLLDDGWDWGDVINDWHSRGIMSATGKPWSVHTLQTIMTSMRIIGKRVAEIEDPDTGEIIEVSTKAAWDPILDAATRDRLLTLIKHVGRHGPKSQYVLSGQITCGKCGQYLTGARRRYLRGGIVQSVRTYRCKSDIANKQRGACGNLSVTADDVERLVIARIVKRLRQTPDFITSILKRDEAFSMSAEQELTNAAAIVEQCQVRLVEIARIGARRKWSDEQFAAAEEEITEEKNEAARRIKHITRKLSVPVPPTDERQDFVTWFERLVLSQQQAFMKACVRTIDIKPVGRLGSSTFDASRVEITLTITKKADQ